MPKIVNLDIYVDAVSDANAKEIVKHLLDGKASADAVIDWMVKDVYEVPESVNDSVVNEACSPGDVFAGFVYFSASEAILGSGAGFWSNEHGWTNRSLATRFTGKEVATFERPQS